MTKVLGIIPSPCRLIAARTMPLPRAILCVTTGSEANRQSTRYDGEYSEW